MNQQNNLSLEERVMALEENLNYMNELLEENAKSFEQLLIALNKLMENEKRNQSELTTWAEKVEERLGKLMVQQVNLSLIVSEAIQLTPEQQKRIEKRVQDIKKTYANELAKNKEKE